MSAEFPFTDDSIAMYRAMAQVCASNQAAATSIDIHLDWRIGLIIKRS